MWKKMSWALSWSNIEILQILLQLFEEILFYTSLDSFLIAFLKTALIYIDESYRSSW